jgi:hypothetical protein
MDMLVAGAPSREEFLEGIKRLVYFLGMDRAGMDPDIRSYPIPDGRGGEGLTIMQPYVEPMKILHQPLTTSFAIIDSWPELGQFTLTIKSCVRFDPLAVLQEVSRIFGRVLDFYIWDLGRPIKERRA